MSTPLLSKRELLVSLRISRSDSVHSLIGTCKNAGIELHVLMEDVLKQIPYYQRDQQDLVELLPFNQKNIIELGLFVTDSSQLVSSRC